MGQQGPKMQGMGANGGRLRNTMANLMSHSKIDYSNPGGQQALPALSPASTANYYAQLGGLYAGYQNQIAALKQQRVGVRADFRSAVSDVKAQKLTGLADTENAAIERGITGSSADLQNRIAVRADAHSQHAELARQMVDQLSQTRIAQQQAGLAYYQGAQQLEAQKLAEQQQMLAQQLEQNAIISGQESQMDAMKAIYQALTANSANNGGNRSGNNPNAPGYTPGLRPLPPGYYGTSGHIGGEEGTPWGPAHAYGPHPH